MQRVVHCTYVPTSSCTAPCCTITLQTMLDRERLSRAPRDSCRISKSGHSLSWNKKRGRETHGKTHQHHSCPSLPCPRLSHSSPPIPTCSNVETPPAALISRRYMSFSNAMFLRMPGKRNQTRKLTLLPPLLLLTGSIFQQHEAHRRGLNPQQQTRNSLQVTAKLGLTHHLPKVHHQLTWGGTPMHCDGSGRRCVRATHTTDPWSSWKHSTFCVDTPTSHTLLQCFPVCAA